MGHKKLRPKIEALRQQNAVWATDRSFPEVAVRHFLSHFAHPFQDLRMLT
jgi:hypothetical protein